MTLRELAPSETGREPETRHPEARYLASHVERRTRLVITLRDGEQLRGRLAWYDRGALRVDREDGRHLVLMKHAIRHLAEDAPPAR
jgi:sRNA-binding regulator protein Hfq